MSFVTLRDSITSFIKVENFRSQIISFKYDIIYLSNFSKKLNFLNKQLEERNSNLISAKGNILTFLGKLEIFWKNIARRKFFQFPSLKSKKTGIITDDDLIIFVKHLKKLYNEMESRFHDILEINRLDL